jgi:hypothetical protein
LGLAGAVALAGGIFYVQTERARPSVVAAQPSAPVAQPSAPPAKPIAAEPPPAKPIAAEPAAPKRVHWSIGGPRGAEAFLDGKRAGPLPLELDLDAVARPRKLTVERAGWLPWTRALDGAADQRVTATLERKPRAPADREDVKDPFSE